MLAHIFDTLPSDSDCLEIAHESLGINTLINLKKFPQNENKSSYFKERTCVK